MIKEFSNSCQGEGKTNVELLRKLLKEHQEVIDIGQAMDRAFSLISMVQVLGSILVICITGFVIITVTWKTQLKI